MRLLSLNASTSNVPMMGPVHENDTNTSVKAMKKMLSRPVVLSALASTAVDHRDGSVISNAPKNEMANTTRSAKKMRLNTAPVAISLSLPGPAMSVSRMPSTRNITMMLAE